MPIARSFGSAQVTSRPPMWMLPSSVSTSPAIACSSVDFPQPEGPSRTRNSPSRTARSSCSITGVEPMRTASWRMATADMAGRVPFAGGFSP